MEDNKKFDYDDSQEIDREEEEIEVDFDDQSSKTKNKNFKHSPAPITWLALLIVIALIFFGWIYFTKLRFERINAQTKVTGFENNQQAVNEISQSLNELGSSLQELVGSIDVGELQKEIINEQSIDENKNNGAVVSEMAEIIKENKLSEEPEMNLNNYENQ